MTFLERSDKLPDCLVFPMLAIAAVAVYTPLNNIPRVHDAVLIEEKIKVIALTLLESSTLLLTTFILNCTIVHLALTEDERRRRQAAYNLIMICTATAIFVTSMWMVKKSGLVPSLEA